MYSTSIVLATGFVAVTILLSAPRFTVRLAEVLRTTLPFTAVIGIAKVPGADAVVVDTVIAEVVLPAGTTAGLKLTPGNVELRDTAPANGAVRLMVIV
jgi:hypothetical protein